MQRNRDQSLIYAGAVLSFIAALIHAAVIGEHLEEWWGYGLFFIVVTAAQGVYAALLIVRPERRVLLAGVVGNLAIIALWVVTRTAGIPLFGPEAGEVEAVGQLDVISKISEALLVVILGALLARAEHDAPVAEARGGPTH